MAEIETEKGRVMKIKGWYPEKHICDQSIRDFINRATEKYGISNLDLKDILEGIIRDYCTQAPGGPEKG